MVRYRRLSKRQANVMNKQGGFDKSALYTGVCSVYTVAIGSGEDAIEITVDNLNTYLFPADGTAETSFRLTPDRGAHTNNGQMNYRLIGFDGKEITSKDSGITARMAQATSADIVVGVPLPNDKKLRIIRLTEEEEQNEDNVINYVISIRAKEINADQTIDEERLTLEDLTTLHNEDFRFNFTTDYPTPGYVEGTGVNGAITEADRRRDKGVAFVRYESDKLTLMNSIIFRGKTNRGGSDPADFFNQELFIDWDKEDLDGVQIKDKFLRMNLLEVGAEVLSTSINWTTFWPNEYKWVLERIGTGNLIYGEEPNQTSMLKLLNDGLQWKGEDRSWAPTPGNELNSNPAPIQENEGSSGVFRKMWRSETNQSESEGTTKISCVSFDTTEGLHLALGQVEQPATTGINFYNGELTTELYLAIDPGVTGVVSRYRSVWNKGDSLFDSEKGLYNLLGFYTNWWYAGILGVGSQWRHQLNSGGIVRNDYFNTQQYYEEFYNPLTRGSFQYQNQVFEVFDEDSDVNVITKKDISSRDLTGVRADNNANDRKYLVQIPMGEILNEGTTQMNWVYVKPSWNPTNRRESTYLEYHRHNIKDRLYESNLIQEGDAVSRIANAEFTQNNYPIDLIFRLSDNIRVDGTQIWNDGIEITQVDINAYCRGNHKITYYNADMEILRVDTIRSASVSDARRLKTRKVYEGTPT